MKSFVLVLAALSAMALIIHDLHARRHGQASYRAAQAIAGGYEADQQAQEAMSRNPPRALSTDPEVRDDQLRADEMYAGATWARTHHAKGVVDCPTESRVFYSGCIAVMRGEWPTDPD